MKTSTSALPNDSPALLTVVEAAVAAERHPATIADACRRGDLPCTWAWGRRLIDPRDLAEWATRAAARRPRRGARP